MLLATGAVCSPPGARGNHPASAHRLSEGRLEENRKKVLGTVSAVALSAGLGGAAAAAVPAEQPAVAPERHEAAAAAVRAGDPFVELVLRTGGSLTAASIVGELRAMFAPLSAAQALELPALIRSIRSLGLGSEVETAAADTLLDLLAAADLPLDDARLEELAAALAAPPARFDLAQNYDAPGAGKASDRGKEKGQGKGVGLYEG